MGLAVAADQVRCPAAGAETPGAFGQRLRQPGIAGQPQIVVAAERQVALSLAQEVRPLPGRRASAAITLERMLTYDDALG